MKAAKRSDWKAVELPLQRTNISLDRSFSQREMEKIRQGLVPQQMEDKWFIYWEDNRLSFHRSWTGFCLYIVRFVNVDDLPKMTEAAVNRDPRQYSETSKAKDAKMISYLVDCLLLRRKTQIPSGEYSPDKAVLENWGVVGRAMLGQHPDGQRYEEPDLNPE